MSLTLEYNRNQNEEKKIKKFQQINKRFQGNSNLKFDEIKHQPNLIMDGNFFSYLLFEYALTFTTYKMMLFLE